MNNDIYDVVIIGSGPGGLSAGIYSARAKLNTLIIEKGYFGGQMLTTGIIENYPGSVKEDTGATLTERMVAQCKDFGVNMVSDEVLEVDLDGDIKVIKGKRETYKAKVVIIATGCRRKKLNLDREDEFLGKGISYCAICDGHLFEELDVYVAGGGDSAVKESIYLSKYAKEVTIINKNQDLKCSKYIEEKCKKIKNIKIINNSKVISLLGDELLNEIRVKNTKTDQEIVFKAKEDEDLIGLFVFIGLESETSLFKGKLDLDQNGYIKTNENMETSLAGVYAVGDCKSKSIKQIITASNDGAIAAINAEKYVN